MRRFVDRFAGAHPFLGVASAVLASFVLCIIIFFPDIGPKLAIFQQNVIARHFSGLLIWTATIIMLFMVVIAFTRYGDVKLGLDDDTPEFGRFSWFSMLFSAGVGTGIMFWGVAEPIFHLQGNPFLTINEIKPGSSAAGVVALRVTLFHWGLHGWAIYSFVGLCLGYFAYRKGLPLTVRSALQPLLRDRVNGAIGNIVDLLAVFSTLFGIAVSLGLGVSQMAGGLNYLFGLYVSPGTKLALVLIVSAIATISAVSGVGRGIRRLSEMNIWLSALLIGSLILVGPTALILSTFAIGTGDYLVHFLPMGIWIDPDRDSNWQSFWTLFYWGWWISWGPFVGMFMARVSRGRRIREYVVGTLLGPTLAGFLWLSVFGVTALNIELTGAGRLIETVNRDMAQALFTTFELLPFGVATWSVSLLATILIVSWFVTSSDSGTLVLCTIVSHGKEHPSTTLRVFWGSVIALVAGFLLVAGGLSALQTASTAIAVPFSVVLLLMMLGLAKSLWQTELRQPGAEKSDRVHERLD